MISIRMHQALCGSEQQKALTNSTRLPNNSPQYPFRYLPIILQYIDWRTQSWKTNLMLISFGYVFQVLVCFITISVIKLLIYINLRKKRMIIYYQTIFIPFIMIPKTEHGLARVRAYPFLIRKIKNSVLLLQKLKIW